MDLTGKTLEVLRHDWTSDAGTMILFDKLGQRYYKLEAAMEGGGYDVEESWVAAPSMDLEEITEAEARPWLNLPGV